MEGRSSDKEAGLLYSLEVSSHYHLATQTSCTFLHGTSREPGPQTTQKTQSQAAGMPRLSLW